MRNVVDVASQGDDVGTTNASNTQLETKCHCHTIYVCAYVCVCVW